MAVPAPPAAVRDLLARGLPVAPSHEQTTALTRYFHRLLTLRTPEANDQLVGVLHGVADASRARARPPRAFACAPGCSTCCSNHVTVLAPEAFALARRHRASRHAPVQQRLRAHRDLQDRTSLLERRAAGQYCGFLDGGLCSTYPARPLVCRMFGSFDFAACLQSAAGEGASIPQSIDHHTLRSTIGIMLFAAMAAAGLRPRGYELAGAVTALFDDPGLEGRWYRGDDGLVSQPRDALSAEVRASAAAFAASAGLHVPSDVDSD